ncbi:4-(cytidine 5'-diphospho)-2-C-methyl-D-erythritol kinase [Desulfogranum marinum]|uniref:4-(cytidine 5'-diphospho)-2-C-methyl-D-erythritol kinase n=1 Tax=Desulfogranum marinum TaxID=453220 RepID=UPI0029C882BD|nr:4-(cytidine 5'-diphospho)-2-C-methyl-D-erythritol kinase [Desulfogranum marinum]
MECSASIQIKAPAKINFFLKVTGKRADGYHTIASLMQKVTLYDHLELRLVDSSGIILHCPDNVLPADDTNLAYRAAQIFLQSAQARLSTSVCGVDITLVKKIPIAAGLGGGSSDAAAVLLGLNSLFADLFSERELAGMGLQLGADVPFFVDRSAACWAEGIGELLDPIASFKDLSIVLVNPGFSVSTKQVYENFILTSDRKSLIVADSRIELWRHAWQESVARQVFPYASLLNDLEQVTIRMHPELEGIKEDLVAHGALVAMMSGSGPTVFAVFEDRQRAQECCHFFNKQYGSVFVTSPFA